MTSKNWIEIPRLMTSWTIMTTATSSLNKLLKISSVGQKLITYRTVFHYNKSPKKTSQQLYLIWTKMEWQLPCLLKLCLWTVFKNLSMVKVLLTLLQIDTLRLVNPNSLWVTKWEIVKQRELETSPTLLRVLETKHKNRLEINILVCPQTLKPKLYS